MQNMIEPNRKIKHKIKFQKSAHDAEIEGPLLKPKSYHNVPTPSETESIVVIDGEKSKKKRKLSNTNNDTENSQTEVFHKLIEPETIHVAMKQEAIKTGKHKRKLTAEDMEREVFNKQIEDTPKLKNMKRMLETIAEKDNSTVIKKSKDSKSPASAITTTVPSDPIAKPSLKPKTAKGVSQESYNSDQYPVLKNEELIKQFMGVSITNNQKGRIRQVLKELVKGTSSAVLPDVINNKIQSILNSSQNLTDTDLRKIRILYNMLKTSLIAQKVTEAIAEKELKKGKKKKKSAEEKKDAVTANKDANAVKKDTEQRIKGPKRYVVFVGNLPVGINKDKVMGHFSDLKDSIKDVRIPTRGQEAKSAIAYVELADEPSFEIALSKHHSMMGSKRINVLYTTQQNSKISKAEAKSKAAKLTAMAKSGQLLGSIALNRKRSQRRKKMKLALKAQSVP